MYDMDSTGGMNGVTGSGGCGHSNGGEQDRFESMLSEKKDSGGNVNGANGGGSGQGCNGATEGESLQDLIEKLQELMDAVKGDSEEAKALLQKIEQKTQESGGSSAGDKPAG